MTTNNDNILNDIRVLANRYYMTPVELLFDVSSCVESPAVTDALALLNANFSYVSDSLIDELIDDLS